MKKYWECLTLLWLVLVPWGTVLIIREALVEYNKMLVYGSEILFWALFVWGLGARYLKKPDINWQTGLLGVFLLLNVFASTDTLLGLQSLRWLIMTAAIVWMVAKNSVASEKIAYAFGLGVLPVIVLGLAQFFAQTTWALTWFGLPAHVAWKPGTSVVVGEFGRWLRAYGSLPHPNIFGGYLVLTILISAWGVKKTTRQWFWLWLAGLSMVVLVFTFSRSAWLGLAFAFVVGYKWFRAPELRLWWATIGLSAFAVVTLVWPVLVGRVGLGSTHEQQSISERVGGWHEAVAVWRTQPLFGVGLGNYTMAVQNVFPNNPVWLYQPVHNAPFLLLAELGLLGLFLVFIVGRRVVWAARQYWWWVLPIAIIGLFDHYFLTLYPGFLLAGLWVGTWVRFVHK